MMRAPTLALLLASLATTAAAAEKTYSRDRVVAKAIAYAEKGRDKLTGFEVEAALILGSKESLVPDGMRDVPPEAVEQWRQKLLGKRIWDILVCPTQETVGGRVREACVHSMFDATTGKQIFLPHK